MQTMQDMCGSGTDGSDGIPLWTHDLCDLLPPFQIADYFNFFGESKYFKFDPLVELLGWGGLPFDVHEHWGGVGKGWV